MSADPLLQLTEVSKTYPNGTVALQGVSLGIGEGEVHALVGANGAGKSTLIKMVAGVVTPSQGTITWRGSDVGGWSPRDARAGGIATIHQAVPLVPTLSVLENTFLGEGRATELIDRDDMRRRFTDLCERVAVQIDPDALVEQLSLGRRQMVALLQVIALGAALIVLDEPTASLSGTERDVVASVVRRLSAKGTAFLYVSHHIEEVLDICDEATVLRDGRVVGQHHVAEIDRTTLIAEMTGDELEEVEGSVSRPLVAPGTPVVLSVRGLSTSAGVSDASLELRQGEILGLFGMMGAGRTELLRAVYGADRVVSGTVTVDGTALRSGTRSRVDAGVAFVPEDRRSDGLLMDWEIWRNTSLPDLGRMSRRFGRIDHAREVQRAATAVRRLEIRTSSVHAPLSTLSGGNQQKVVFSKWVQGDYRIFLLDEPTVAVDVHAKAQILQLVRELADNGSSIVFNSSEPEEVLAIAERIIVMAAGRIVGELTASTTTKPELVALATGALR